MAAEHTYFSLAKFFFKIYFTLSKILILAHSEQSVTGMVRLSPMMVAPVCHVGDPLTMTCTASVQLIEWSITVVNQQGTLEKLIAYSGSVDTSEQLMQKIVNSTTFTFMRSSAQGASPLISTLSIDSISIGLNGTVVHCMEVGGFPSESTTIHIVHISNNQYTPALDITSEEYETDNVTVTVEWPRQVGVQYYVRVLVPIIIAGNTSYQVTISYNIECNFTVEAIAPCRGSATASILLYYANCGYPELPSTVSNDSVPRVEGYDGLPIEGVNITFSCPPGLVLTGSNSATCMGNGDWEPDTNGLICNESKACDRPLLTKTIDSSLYIVNYSEPAIVGITVSFSCLEPGQVLVGPNTTTCMSDGQWAPDPSQLMMNCKVSCEAPDSNINIYYSSYNSTLEGSTVTFQCMNMLASTKVYTTMCHRNTSWYPDPVNKCTATLRSDDKGSDRTAIIAGGSLGALVVFIVLILIVIVGISVCIKKGLFQSHKNNLALNVELNGENSYNHIVHHYQQNEEDNYNHIVHTLQSAGHDDYCTVHDQQNKATAGTLVYADVGSLSNNRPQRRVSESNFTVALDHEEHSVEYALLNHKAQHSKPRASVEKSVNEDTSLTLDSLLIQLQGKVTPNWYQFGAALGIEKAILDQCLKYPSEQSIIEILDHWLRSHEEQSWTEIAMALRQIDYHHLARDIENIDKMGKMAIEVNMDTIPEGVLHGDFADDEPPPPIPPKMFEDDPEDLQQREIFVSSAAPILPPKPKPKP